MQQLLDKLESREALIGVLGLGYVGLPLAVLFAESGYAVLGFETDESKKDELEAGRSYIKDVPSEQLAKVILSGRSKQQKGKLSCADSFAELKDCDAVVICVPTPLAKTKDPNLSYVVDASKVIAENMHGPQLIVLESTTYPGTTRELILPILEDEGKRKVGKDFFLAYSPERVDPGNEKYTIRNTPKVIGGVCGNCVSVATALYSSIVEQTVPVSSTDAAELSKLLENTFRLINIGLVNEFTLMCRRLGVDVWEVIDAAATKPFGFIPFYPGPGLGGHCIPVDPHYLSWKLRLYNYRTRFIELASEVNAAMPAVVVERVTEALNTHKKAMNGSKVLVMGVAYKKDIDDVRESPAFDVLELIKRKGAEVSFCDPHVEKIKLSDGSVLHSEDYSTGVLEKADCVVLVTDHSCFRAEELFEHSPLIVDTRNFFAKNGVTDAEEKTLFKL